jgi:hypothetical protein
MWLEDMAGGSLANPVQDNVNIGVWGDVNGFRTGAFPNGQAALTTPRTRLTLKAKSTPAADEWADFSMRGDSSEDAFGFKVDANGTKLDLKHRDKNTGTVSDAAGTLPVSAIVQGAVTTLASFANDGTVTIFGDIKDWGNFGALGSVTGNQIGAFYHVYSGDIDTTQNLTASDLLNGKSFTTSTSDGRAAPGATFYFQQPLSGDQVYAAIATYCVTGDSYVSLGYRGHKSNLSADNYTFFPPMPTSISGFGLTWYGAYTIIYTKTWGPASRPSGFTSYQTDLTCFSPNG